MTAADRLIDYLASAPHAGSASVVGWRLEVAEDEGLRVGIRDSDLGGPYEGPGTALRLGGSLELHWSDGKISRGSVDRRAVLEPAAQLEGWRAGAFSPRRGLLPPLAGSVALPAVQTLDPAIADVVSGDPSPLLDLLRRMGVGAHTAGARRVDAVLRASSGERTVATSREFFSRWQETACAIRLWADELGGGSFDRRSMPSAAEVEELTARAVTLARQLREPASLPPRARGVLLMPAAVDGLLGRFLLPNLVGRAIRDGRSLFTVADLASRRQVLRGDLSLVVDTTLPFEMATAPCSPEGVPAGRVALIDGGRLVAPLLDLETAAELQLPPTPAPRGRPHALLLGAEPALDLDAALARLGDGIIVRELPGLHTQPSRRAIYALVAPDAQVVRSGVAGGRAAVRVAGNVVDHVSQPSTCLVRIVGESGVGLLVLESVELLPA